MNESLELLKQSQLSIMLFLAGVCATTSVFVFFTRNIPVRRKHALFLMGFSAMVLLIADRFAYIYRGQPGELAFYMVRISNFLVFFLIPVILYAFNLYLIDICSEEAGGRLYIPRSLKITRILILIDVLLLIISQFSTFCYYFDDSNTYHRGKGYIILVLIQLVVLLIQISVIIQNRRRYSKVTLLILMLFIIVPIIATAVQVLVYGISLINISLVGMVVLLYVFTLGNLSAQMDEYVDEILAMSVEKERVSTELSIANKIQEGTLPNKFPAFPERPEFDIYASMTPAKEVGGDLYDFFLVDGDHLAMVIADVSGKGVSAALFMVITKTLIDNQVENGGQDPAEVFSRVNAKLMRINKACMFVTAWLGILTISTGELIYVNAGHEYPAIRRRGKKFEMFKDVHGVPLAASKRAKFKSDSFTLNPGDSLYVYTDGVPEANNRAGEMFGKERMIDALNKDADAAPEIIDRNVHEAIAAFVQDADQFDDTTMLCLKYYGANTTAQEAD